MNRVRVESALLEMGMSMKPRGFDYISDAVVLMSESKGGRINMYFLYTLIAEKYGTTWTCVERGIRYAFDKVRGKEKHRDAVEHYIGTEDKTNTASLKMLYHALKVEQEGGAAA